MDSLGRSGEKKQKTKEQPLALENKGEKRGQTHLRELWGGLRDIMLTIGKDGEGRGKGRWESKKLHLFLNREWGQPEKGETVNSRAPGPEDL